VLAARHGDGGPGQFFPARPLTLYDRRDIGLDDGSTFTGVSTRGRRIADDYGRAGIALDTRVATRACARLPRTVTHVEAWARGGGATLTIEADGQRASVVTSVSTVTASLDVSTRDVCIAADGPLRSFGIIAETGHGVVVEGFGVPGARAQDALLWNEASFGEQMAMRPPDLFVLAYGTNESAQHRSAAHLRADMHAVIARFRRAAPSASCLVIGPSDRERPQTTRVRDAYRDAAAANDCAFFDLLAWMGGPGAMSDWVTRGLALPDRTHFTDATYARLGRALADRIDAP
jgi:lysophospholipase L1-like esterase